MEKKVADIAKKNGIALLGPNCLGTIDTHSGLNASFAASTPKKGHTAFLSQSGALGTAIIDKAISEGVGFSKFISLGNEASLSEIEFMEYLKDDADTKAILMYVEQLKDGHEFMRFASEITKRKPIVLIKAGKGAPCEAHVEISPDGMRWIREGASLVLPTAVDGLALARVRHFGNWLRLACDLPDEAEATVLVSLHLK